MNDRRESFQAIPHDEIQRAEDQSWTERLLSCFAVTRCSSQE
ncbi:hypothetical protein ACSRUE_15565 [Sorangium sp. KYC3313]